MTTTPLGPARPFRFGVASKRARPRTEWVQFAQRVESLGYSTLSLTDHTRPQFGLFPALQCAADATTTLRVGTLVANNDFRNPVMLAREAATVDILSEGRLELGLGAGWLQRDYWESSIAWDRGADRVARFGEAVEVISRTLTDETFSFDGRSYRIQDLQGGPVPVQQPLPMLIGAGSARLLTIAARHASIVSLARSMAAGPTWADAAADATAASTDSKVATLVEAAGERASELELHVLAGNVVIGARAVTEVERLSTEFRLDAADVRDTPQHLFGDVDEVTDTLVARRARFGLSYVTVPEEAVDDFAPVVSALCGR